MKRILISFMLVIIMLALFSLPAAASETDDVRAALAKIQAQFPGVEQVAKLVSDANTWLVANGDNLPTGSGAIVEAQVNAAIATAGGASSLSALSEAQRNSILGNIAAAADAVNLAFSVSISGGVYTFTLRNADGTVISTAANNPIKQTGQDTITIVIITIGITILFGIAITVALITGKKRQPNAV